MTLDKVQEKLQTTISLLNQLFEKELDQQLTTPIESSQLLTLLVMTLNTLIYQYLRINSSNTILVKQEMKRCKVLVDKLNSVRLVIDKDATRRLLH